MAYRLAVLLLSVWPARAIQENDSVLCESPSCCAVHLGPPVGDDRWRYRCDADHQDVGPGLVTCTSAGWSPPVDELCMRTCKPFAPSNLAAVYVDTPGGPASGTFLVGSRVRIVCTFAVDLSYSAVCSSNGSWFVTRHLDQRTAHFLTTKNAISLCSEPAAKLFTDRQPNHCQLFNVDWNQIRADYTQTTPGPVKQGDQVRLYCRRRDGMLDTSIESLRTCMANGLWSDQSKPACVYDGCTPPPVFDQVKPVYQPLTRPHSWPAGPNSFYTKHGHVAVGVRVFFECKDKSEYYLVGERLYTCLANGQWSVPEWPVCVLKQYCDSPPLPIGGYYDVDIRGVKFVPGRVLGVVCEEDFQVQGTPFITCMDNGHWDNPLPMCQSTEWSSKRFIVIMSVLFILGTLMLALISLACLKHILLRKFHSTGRLSRLSANVRSVDPHFGLLGSTTDIGASNQSAVFAQISAPCMYTSDLDRLALIRFADDLQPPLPSYDEAIGRMVAQRRAVPCFDSLSTLSGYCSRALGRLPSLSSLRSREQRHHSASHGNVSNPVTIDSADVVTISDTTSTAVTLDTVGSSLCSRSLSNRPQAGSMCSVTSNPFSVSSGAGLSSDNAEGSLSRTTDCATDAVSAKSCERSV